MKVKNSRLETLKMLISSQELSSQDQLLQALAQEGFEITQATLSRDLKLLKVAKAASSSGKYTYVLPNDALYKRVSNHIPISNMAMGTGFLSSTSRATWWLSEPDRDMPAALPTTLTTATSPRFWEPSQEMTPSSSSRKRELQKKRSSMHFRWLFLNSVCTTDSTHK